MSEDEAGWIAERRSLQVTLKEPISTPKFKNTRLLLPLDEDLDSYDQKIAVFDEVKTEIRDFPSGPDEDELRAKRDSVQAQKDRLLSYLDEYKNPETVVTALRKKAHSPLVTRNKAEEIRADSTFLKERLTQMKSWTDTVTGLYSRTGFIEQMSQLIENPELFIEQGSENLVGSSVGLIMLDLDKFKDFNERFGHGKGDEVLEKFCTQAVEALRDFDIMFRFGGEEFVIVLFGGDIDKLLLTDVRVFERLKNLNITGPGGEVLQVNFSAGGDVVEWDNFAEAIKKGDRESLNKLLKQANQNMRQAKTEGRGRMVTSEDK